METLVKLIACLAYQHYKDGLMCFSLLAVFFNVYLAS